MGFWQHMANKISNTQRTDRAAQAGTANRSPATTRMRGDAAEAAAVAWLQQRGLVLVQRNYRTPGRGGGEIDAIMRAPDGTVVFVEVRQRSSHQHGGAAASIGTAKRKRLVLAARHWLLACGNHPPPCRFDVMAADGQTGLNGHLQWQWLQGAFDAEEAA